VVQDFAESPLVREFGVFAPIEGLGLITAAIAAAVALRRNAGAPPVPVLFGLSGFLIMLTPALRTHRPSSSPPSGDSCEANRDPGQPVRSHSRDPHAAPLRESPRTGFDRPPEGRSQVARCRAPLYFRVGATVSVAGSKRSHRTRGRRPSRRRSTRPHCHGGPGVIGRGTRTFPCLLGRARGGQGWRRLLSARCRSPGSLTSSAGLNLGLRDADGASSCPITWSSTRWRRCVRPMYGDRIEAGTSGLRPAAARPARPGRRRRQPRRGPGGEAFGLAGLVDVAADPGAASRRRRSVVCASPSGRG
jgi:hypothetical protein